MEGEVEDVGASGSRRETARRDLALQVCTSYRTLTRYSVPSGAPIAIKFRKSLPVENHQIHQHPSDRILTSVVVVLFFLLLALIYGTFSPLHTAAFSLA